MARDTLFDAARIKALDAQASSMLGVFAARRYARVEPPILQPADIFLDRSGEEIRRRTFVVNDAAGNELCLRPELTIPVCRAHLESKAPFPAKLSYHGPAFRVPQSTRARPNQFLQTGVENLGSPKSDAADAEVLALAIEAVRSCGLKNFSLRIGDVALFNDLVDALNVPAEWRGRLKRHFWRPDYFQELLVRLSASRASGNPFVAEIAAAGKRERRAIAERIMDGLGAAPLAGRSREEIIERLLEQAAEESTSTLDAGAMQLIEDVLSVSGEARGSVDKIAAILKKGGVRLDAPLKAMEKRLAQLAKLGLKNGAVNFAARFGRNMEYYTGFVFELWSRDAEGAVQIAGGGRYDNLLRGLGAKRDIPAVGVALRGERILAAKAAQKVKR